MDLCAISAMLVNLFFVLTAIVRIRRGAGGHNGHAIEVFVVLFATMSITVFLLLFLGIVIVSGKLPVIWPDPIETLRVFSPVSILSAGGLLAFVSVELFRKLFFRQSYPNWTGWILEGKEWSFQPYGSITMKPRWWPIRAYWEGVVKRNLRVSVGERSAVVTVEFRATADCFPSNFDKAVNDAEKEVGGLVENSLQTWPAPVISSGQVAAVEYQVTEYVVWERVI